jgi:hypothetical protein
MKLELTAAEQEFLLEVLHGRHGELREQVYHSTVSTFHDQLTHQKTLLKQIIEKVEAASRTGQNV